MPVSGGCGGQCKRTVAQRTEVIGGQHAARKAKADDDMEWMEAILRGPLGNSATHVEWRTQMHAIRECIGAKTLYRSMCCWCYVVGCVAIRGSC